MELKENINRENNRERSEKRDVASKSQRRFPPVSDSPKRDKSESQSRIPRDKTSSKESVNIPNTINISDDGEKFMNKKRQRVEEESPININNTEKVVNLVEIQEEKETPMLVDPKSNPTSPVYALNVTTTDGSKKEGVFDMVNISKGVNIQHSRALCQLTQKIEHKYVFGNVTLNNFGETEWKTVLNVSSIWAAVGVCSKEQVITNKYRFITTNPQYNNATYAISTNGYSWNCQVPSENNNSIVGFPKITKGDIVIFNYNSETKELNYKIPSKLTGKLTNVVPTKGGSLVPCLILLNAGDEVLLEMA
jgi:hypothetical protein